MIKIKCVLTFAGAGSGDDILVLLVAIEELVVRRYFVHIGQQRDIFDAMLFILPPVEKDFQRLAVRIPERSPFFVFVEQLDASEEMPLCNGIHIDADRRPQGCFLGPLPAQFFVILLIVFLPAGAPPIIAPHYPYLALSPSPAPS